MQGIPCDSCKIFESFTNALAQDTHSCTRGKSLAALFPTQGASVIQGSQSPWRPSIDSVFDSSLLNSEQSQYLIGQMSGNFT
jgi:hypothetical protein